MTNLKTTKRALLSSVVALLICFTMLLGTTFAWFTDSAISADNKIVAGTLDVELYQWTSATQTEGTNISQSQTPVFTDDILWEPGMTQVRYLSIKNTGSLALKYKVTLDVTEQTNDSLLDVMSYVITPDAKYDEVTAWAGNGVYLENGGANATAAVDVALAPGAEHFFALSVHMDEEAGNEYQAEKIAFDIKVLAGQLTYEEDSFGNTYDALAGYPGKGYTPAMKQNDTAAEIKVLGEDGYKIGSVVIPKDAADVNATSYSANFTETTYDYNFTVATGYTATTLDITVEGLKDGNTTPVKVSTRIEPNLDPATVKVYHYDTEIDCDYNPNTGYVTFETATFSPYTFVRDTNSEYVAPEATAEYPVATVTEMPEYVGADANIEWGNYGQWSPAAGLEANLEAAYKFACPTDLANDVRAAYEYWYCDFFVSLDKDLGANELFLGGNYGDFGWVGFHNGDLTPDANTEIALLSSVTTNPWTYSDVEQFVGEFICGVGDVNDALAGATFTVELRLINPAKVDPENNPDWWANMAEDAYITVNTVSYTFE